MPAITTPGYEQGIRDRDHFIDAWAEFAEANGVTARPVRLRYDGDLIMGAIPPVHLLYESPEAGRQPLVVSVDLLYGYSEQAKNEVMEALRAHQGVITPLEAAGPDTFLKVRWDAFRNPAPPPIVDDEVIAGQVIRDQIPDEWRGDFSAYFNRKGAALSWPAGTNIARGEYTFTLVQAPWRTIAFMGGRPLFWHRRVA